MGFFSSRNGAYAPETLGGEELRRRMRELCAKRSTGRWHLEWSGETSDLYLLFGAVFHAEASDGAVGEAVVMSALEGGRPALATFDPRAKLPRATSISDPKAFTAAL